MVDMQCTVESSQACVVPAPTVFSEIDWADLESFERRIVASVTTELRICASCGWSSMGLERVEHDATAKESAHGNWRRVPCSPKFTAITYNPNISVFVNCHKGKVWLCGTCRFPARRMYRARLVPPLPPAWSAALFATTWETLHRKFSLIDTRFSVQEAWHGYSTGTFASAGMLPGPLLRHRGAHPPAVGSAETAVLATLQAYIASTPVYRAFQPVYSRDLQTLSAVPPTVWRHTIERDRNRDPRQGDDDLPEGHTVMELHTATPYTGRAIAGNMLRVDGQRLGA